MIESGIMRRIPVQFYFICFLIITGFPCFAFSLKPDTIRFAPYGGISYGEAREFVYWKDQVLSQLVWDLKPAASMGLQSSIGWIGGLQLNADISACLPLESGHMTDSDFLNVEINGSAAKTQFSEHNAFINYAYDFSCSAGWRFILPFSLPGGARNVSVEPNLGFRYMLWKWKSKDGYLQHPDEPNYPSQTDGSYTEWTEDTEKVTVYGTPIIYQQQYYIPSAGFGINVPIGLNWMLSFCFTGSFYVYCNAIDNHFLGTVYTGYWDYRDAPLSKDYYDFTSGGYMVDPGVSITRNITESLSVFLDADWSYIWNLRGYTEVQSSTGGAVSVYSEENGGGASFNTIQIKLGLNFRL